MAGAGGTTTAVWAEVAGELEPRAGIDARRHLHAENAIVLHLARALARDARISDDLSGALAMAARPRLERVGGDSFNCRLASRFVPPTVIPITLDRG